MKDGFLSIIANPEMYRLMGVTVALIICVVAVGIVVAVILIIMAKVLIKTADGIGYVVLRTWRAIKAFSPAKLGDGILRFLEVFDWGREKPVTLVLCILTFLLVGFFIGVNI